MSVELISLFISAFISSTIAPGGSEAVLAYLVSQDHYSISELLSIATLGNTLGAITTWYLGVFAAKKWSPSTLLSTNHQRALTLLEKHGVWLLLFSWLPLIGDALCFAGGWLKLPFALACLLIALGKLARYALIAGVFA
jgi:membrane protein YqaA with SNARE-associated domain